MNTPWILAILLLSSVTGGSAQEGGRIPWNAPAYGPQFSYFQERRTQDRESWNALEPGDQRQELDAVQEAAVERRGQVLDYYNGAMQKWDSAQLRLYISAISEQDLRSVSIWLGPERGDALAQKVFTLRSLAQKSGRQALDRDDVRALEYYLRPDAVDGIKSVKLAADSAVKPLPDGKNKWASSKSGGKLNDFAGADPSGLTEDKLSRLYTGGAAGGYDKTAPSGIRLAGDGRVTGAAPRGTASNSLKTAFLPTLNTDHGPREGGEIERLEKVFNGTIERLSAEGKRRPGTGALNGVMNNFSTLWNDKRARCYEQSEELMLDLGRSYGVQNFGAGFTDPSGRWKFEISTYYGEGHEANGHYWVTAVSQDPNEPTLIMDPWSGEIKRVKEKNPVVTKSYPAYLMGFYLSKTAK